VSRLGTDPLAILTADYADDADVFIRATRDDQAEIGSIGSMPRQLRIEYAGAIYQRGQFLTQADANLMNQSLLNYLR
jgi:hypothetical protein